MLNLHAHLFAAAGLLLLAAAACGWVERRITVDSIARNFPAMKYDGTKPRGKRWH